MKITPFHTVWTMTAYGIQFNSDNTIHRNIIL